MRTTWSPCWMAVRQSRSSRAAKRTCANLALRLAISQMIADRGGPAALLLVLDEIFGSLDEERRLAVVELLRSLADRFPRSFSSPTLNRCGMLGSIGSSGSSMTADRGVAQVRDEPEGELDGLAA